MNQRKRRQDAGILLEKPSPRKLRERSINTASPELYPASSRLRDRRDRVSVGMPLISLQFRETGDCGHEHGHKAQRHPER